MLNFLTFDLRVLINEKIDTYCYAGYVTGVTIMMFQ